MRLDKILGLNAQLGNTPAITDILGKHLYIHYIICTVHTHA